MGVKLLMNLGSQLCVVQALVQGQCQTAKLLGGFVVATLRADRNGVGHVAIGRLLTIAVRERKPHHHRRDQARERLISFEV